MKNQNIAKEILKIKSLISEVRNATSDNLNLQSEWAKYLCVLSSGLLENGIKEIYSDFSQNKTSEPISKYITSTLSPIKNPKHGKFLDIAGAFKQIWKTDLENFMQIDGKDTAIDSIMNNRHLIAHGRSSESKITISQLKEYLEKSIQVLEFIEDQCIR